MKRRAAAALAALLLGCGDSALDLDGMRVVDLSHPFDEQTISWPTEEGFVLETCMYFPFVDVFPLIGSKN